MAYSTFKTAADLFTEAEKLRTRLKTCDCRPDEIPGIIEKIERTHQRMLELDCKILKHSLEHPSAFTNNSKDIAKLLEIINKYLKYHRTDEDDRKMLPANKDVVFKVEKLNIATALHMTAVLEFNQEKAAYVNRVVLLLADVAMSVTSHVFDEKRLKWVHESEHQPRWLEYDLVEGHTPWEMGKIQQILTKTLQKSSAITDSDILQCFANVAKLFDKAMHPGPSLLRGKMQADTAAFYQQQINGINQLSFIAPSHNMVMEPVRV